MSCTQIGARRVSRETLLPHSIQIKRKRALKNSCTWFTWCRGPCSLTPHNLCRYILFSCSRAGCTGEEASSLLAKLLSDQITPHSMSSRCISETHKHLKVKLVQFARKNWRAWTEVYSRYVRYHVDETARIDLTWEYKSLLLANCLNPPALLF